MRELTDKFIIIKSEKKNCEIQRRIANDAQIESMQK